ncbi:MAG: hypothetical protein V1855_01170, partial [bacterium]
VAKGTFAPVDDFTYGKDRPKETNIKGDPYYRVSEALQHGTGKNGTQHLKRRKSVTSKKQQIAKAKQPATKLPQLKKRPPLAMKKPLKTLVDVAETSPSLKEPEPLQMAG